MLERCKMCKLRGIACSEYQHAPKDLNAIFSAADCATAQMIAGERFSEEDLQTGAQDARRILELFDEQPYARVALALQMVNVLMTEELFAVAKEEADKEKEDREAAEARVKAEIESVEKEREK